MNIKDVIPKKHSKGNIMKNSATNNVGDNIYYPHHNEQNLNSITNKQSSNDNMR